jgi:uncharacterized protein
LAETLYFCTLSAKYHKKMNQKFIGREKEQILLQKAFDSDESEMIAVIGRRRVGKTFLIRSVFESSIRFELTGQQNASLRRQLSNFTFQLGEFFGDIAPDKVPTDWQEAFQQLIICLKKIEVKEKIVLFFDEIPWLSMRKSGFLEGLDFFWNSWAVKKNIIVVICGSAASWMIRKVVYHKGGLHNRITKQIHLQPFNLYETELFLKSKNILLDRYQILQVYMAMGGIPHYLKELENGKSAVQNIEQLCFSNTGLLADEFQKLYPALFENPDNHIAIITALSQKWKGLTRQEIIEDTKTSDGGGLTRCLEELASSGFITEYAAFSNRKKDIYYRLTDEYSLFYLKFIQNRKKQAAETWQHFSQTPQYIAWSGYAFESICLKHTPQIKKALSIAGIYTETSGYYQRGTDTEKGLQIDLLLDRRDNVIDLFELKFYNESLRLEKSDALALREKMATFKRLTQTRKQIFLSFLTTFGLTPNENSIGLVARSLTMDVLFEPA